jgi:hypothetical protein
VPSEAVCLWQGLTVRATVRQERDEKLSEVMTQSSVARRLALASPSWQESAAAADLQWRKLEKQYERDIDQVRARMMRCGARARSPCR